MTARLIVVLQALLLAACSGGAGVPPDGGQVRECDPSLQDCPAGMTCDLVCVGTQSKIACRSIPAGASAAGQACAQTTACAAGTGCYQTPTATTSTCVPYCAGDGDCQTGTTCQERTVSRSCGASAPQHKLKLCLP
jgi:hypothetical protein